MVKYTLAAALVLLGVLFLSACGGGDNTAHECDLCTLADHQAALGTPGPSDHCATGHGADGHRLECNACERNCTPQAASLRCGNDLDSSVCADGVF
jgi:hypothetical protein